MELEGYGKDPASSAVSGFMPDTWFETAQNEPETQGKSRAEILHMRYDNSPSGQQFRARMGQKLAVRNGQVLSGHGVPVNDGTLRLAHWLGSDAAVKVAFAPPETPLKAVVGDAVINANPQLRGLTTGQMVQKTAQQMEGVGDPFASHQAGMEATGTLNEEQRRASAASISQLESDRSAILEEARRAPVGSAERMQMLHEAHDHARELTKLYEDKIKSPPEKKPTDVFAGWGGIAIALAALAGSRSAQPLTASLNAMSGAMDAMNEGNYKDYQDRMKIWDKQSEFALKAIDIQNTEIREILEAERISEAEKQARLSTFYHVAGMDQQIALQRSHETEQEYNNLYKMFEMEDKLRNENERMREFTLNYQQREQKLAGSPLQQQNIKLYEDLEAAQTPEERKIAQQRIDDWNRAQGKGVSAPRSAVGAMRAALTKEHPDWDETKMEDALLEYHRLSSIESGFGGGVLGRNVVSLNTVADHAMRVREYFEALNNGQIPRANQIANTISKETGGPEVTNFEAGATIMTGEVTRLLTTTGGAESDRERMLSLITPIMSKAQGKGALNVFDDMINARFELLRTQFAAGRPDRAEKFDKQLLSPAARALHETTLSREGARATPSGTAAPPSGPDYSKMSDDELLRSLGLR